MGICWEDLAKWRKKKGRGPRGWRTVEWGLGAAGGTEEGGGGRGVDPGRGGRVDTMVGKCSYTGC